jgi:hypothetical protein
MHRFWIVLPVALALAAPAAYAGKLDTIEKAAKTVIVKKETSKSTHGLLGGNSHGKAGGILSKGKKLLGK